MKYGVKNNVSGVYKITCKHNDRCYIGASVNIAARFSNHMGRDSRRYLDSEFYADVRKYGNEGFIFEVLEECDKPYLLEKEQYYFDLLQPSYNQIRPSENHLNNPVVRKKAMQNGQTAEKIEDRKKLYNSLEYREIFRTMHKDRMKPVQMIDKEGSTNDFISIRDCARWLDENTSFKSKNKASKVKSVCDGERAKAFGYTFRYLTESVETIS